MNYAIQRLGPDLEAAFLTWRSHGQPGARDILERELDDHRTGDCEIFVAALSFDQPGAGQRARMNALIGTVQLVFEHDDLDLADGFNRAYVQALEVRLEYRRHGLGRALMRHLEPGAMRRGFSRLTLMVEPNNHAALELYRELGYRAFKTSSWHWQGRDYPTLCLEKAI